MISKMVTFEWWGPILLFLLFVQEQTRPISSIHAANLDDGPKTSLSNGPRIEIKPAVPIVFFEASTQSNKVLTCKALGDKPGMFNLLRWTGPNRQDNWDELAKKHKVRETTRNGHSLELEFLRPTQDDSGTYYCHGTYQSSDVYNASVNVKVYNPIRLENCPERQFVVDGATGQKITCRITGDSPSVFFSKDGVSIDQLENRYKWDNEDGLEILGPVNKLDAGDYAIEVTADLTGDRRVHHITVEVHSKPDIAPSRARSGDLAEFTGIEGEQAELKCEVSGNPRPLVYWLDPRLRNLTSVGGYAVNPERGSLLISKVNRVDDNGNFQCIAYNTVGDTRRQVSMAVLQRPAVVAFENKTVDENSEVTFECRSTGFPRPVMTIRRQGLNQVPYRIGDGFVKDVDETEEGGGAQVYVYRLKMLANRSHFGLHYCNATNLAGSSERVGQLTVNHRPDLSLTPPEQYVKLGKKITVTCHIKAFPEPKVSWYSENSQILNVESGIKTSPDKQVHIVTMMPPPNQQSAFTRYTCVAENTMGRAEQTIIPRFTTPPGIVHATILDRSPTTVKLQIAVSNDGGDRVKAFRYRAEGTTMDIHNPTYLYPIDRQNETYIDASPTTTTYTIRNLFPFYKYRISIRAINDVGDGDLSDVHVETTRATRPDSPVIIKPGVTFGAQSSTGFSSEYQNGYLLRWSPPDLDNGDPIIKYIIKVNKVDADNPDIVLDAGEQRIIEQMNERPMYARIGPLEVNQRYKIQLQARNKYGDSDPAHIVIYTLPDRPTMPDFGPQALTWLTEPSTSVLIALLILAIIALVVIDIIFCFCFQIGVSHSIRNWCCPAKTNSVISDKTYS